MSDTVKAYRFVSGDFEKVVPADDIVTAWHRLCKSVSYTNLIGFGVGITVEGTTVPRPDHSTVVDLATGKFRKIDYLGTEIAPAHFAEAAHAIFPESV